MQVIDTAHEYKTEDGQTIQFIKRTNGELVHAGTTNEELLEILLDRTRHLDAKFPCVENKIAIHHMASALTSFNRRTQARVAQGVETKDLQHVPGVFYGNGMSASNSAGLVPWPDAPHD